MVAYFSSKFNKRIQGVIALGLIVICLLGTHWVGLNHSISHAQNSQSMELVSGDLDPLLQHSSESCHLFDALSLASFISSDINVVEIQNQFNEVLFGYGNTLKTPQSVALYQSRAPPSLFL
jgi:mannose/fructose/N-acetylgalactosamine-specific phosphotransferase system component IID